MKTLQGLELRVPEDVAVVGFDDLPPALITFPFLTMTDQPAYEMGCKATELLLAWLSGETPANQEIIPPVEIVIHKSRERAIDL